MMKLYHIVAFVFLLGSAAIVNGIEETTSREIVERLCLFRKCKNDDDDDRGGKGGSMGGKMSKDDKKGGKGKRRLATTNGNIKEDLFMKIDALSTNDKHRLLIAIEELNDEMVDEILTGSERRTSALDNGREETASREIVERLCLFRKCRNDDDDDRGGKGGKMSKDDKKGGKGKRRLATTNGNIKEDLFMKIDALSTNDKHRLMIAIEELNDEMVDEILAN